MHRNGDLIRRSKHPRIRHLPRHPQGILNPLRPQGKLPGQPQSLSGSAPLQTALRRSPKPVREVIHRLSQPRRIHHAARLRAVPGLLPTGERSGTVT
jgi:hypothetical protein